MTRSFTTRPLLHVITDPTLGGHGHLAIARAAIAGGADVVQLRDKSALPDELFTIAEAIASWAREAGVLFVVNDSLDLARKAGAGGIHLGPADLGVAAARALWPRPLVLGGSARDEARARRLESEGADYLGVGPVFETRTKEGVPSAIGVDAIRRLAGVVSIPLIGIGGVDETNVGLVVGAGGAGVAVVSAVARARDPEAAVRGIRRALDEAGRLRLE